MSERQKNESQKNESKGTDKTHVGSTAPNAERSDVGSEKMGDDGKNAGASGRLLEAHATEPGPTIDGLVDELVNIGTVWARHGLTLGRSALLASAQTLAGTARVLSDVADTLRMPPVRR